MRIDAVLRDLVTHHPDPPRPASAVRISRFVLLENAIYVLFLIPVLLGVGGGALLTERGSATRVVGLAALVGGLIGVGAVVRTARRDVTAGRDGVLCGAVIERCKYVSLDDGRSLLRVWARVEHPDGAFDAKGNLDFGKHDLAEHREGRRVEVLVHPRRRRVLYWLGRD